MIKIKKSKLLFIFICFSPFWLIGGFFGYLYIDEHSTIFRNKEDRYFYKKLEEFKESGKESIELKKLTNFEWDEVCYIHPYGWTHKDTEQFKFNKSLPSESDSISSLIFFNNRTKIAIVLVINRNSSRNIDSDIKDCSSNPLLKFSNSTFLLTN